MLADVDAGSDTPSFVRQVLKWRSENSSEGVQKRCPVSVSSHQTIPQLTLFGLRSISGTSHWRTR
jgi:hypothetical protein